MKNNFFTHFLLLSLLCSSLLSNDLKTIKQKGEIRHLGIPYANFITGSGDGLDVEIIKGFAQYLGVKYTYVPTSWETLFGDLTGQNAQNSKNGAIFLEKAPIKGDIIANGLTILDWRKEVVNFSTPTFPSGVWLIARSDSNLQPIQPGKSILEDINIVKSLIAGKSVLALENSCLDPRLYNLEQTKADVRIQPANMKLNELVPAILNHHAETTLLDVPDALVALERWPGEIKVIGPISQKQKMAVAMRKTSPELLKSFNQYFKTIQEDGSYIQLVQKYYPDVFHYYGEFFKQ